MLENIIIPSSKTHASRGRSVRRCWSGQRVLGLVLAAMLVCSSLAYGESNRKLRAGPPPDYPELARKLNIRGVARVQATVMPDGSVKEVKELGGNPVLVEALARTVKKWRYEPADKTSVVEVQFAFATE